ncbi:MAG: SPOR domain-containing protein [Pseudomonadota bacterium]|nr:SPOR domain-containing protein [Pseudomonadota bacterium]
MVANSKKHKRRGRGSVRTGRRTKRSGFSTKSFLAGITTGILGTLGLSLLPSLNLGDATLSSDTSTVSDLDSSSTRYEFWKTLPVNDVAVNTNPYEKGSNKTADAKEYLVQAGSFRRQDEADALRAELILAGMPATTSEVRLVGEDQWFRVLVGPYESPRETRQAMTELRTKKISVLLLERPPGGG